MLKFATLESLYSCNKWIVLAIANARRDLVEHSAQVDLVGVGLEAAERSSPRPRVGGGSTL